MTYKNDNQKEQAGLVDPFPKGQKGSAADRIEELIRGRGAREIARVWGIPPSTINSFLERKGDPKLSMLLAICKAEGVSLKWLATGEGQMYEDAQADRHTPTSKPEHAYSYSDLEPLVQVPAYDIEAAAGAGAWISTENIRDYWYVPRAWLRQERLEHAELCLINTIGDSMAPNINHGDRLLVKTNINREKALEGVFVINLDGHLKVKRLEATLFPAGYRVISDSELYPEEFIPANELHERMHVIGEVMRVFGAPASQPAKHQSNE